MEDCWVVRAAWHLRGDHRAWWEAKATIVWPRNTGSKRKSGWREIDTSPNTSNYPFYDSFLRFAFPSPFSPLEKTRFFHTEQKRYTLKEKNCFFFLSLLFVTLFFHSPLVAMQGGKVCLLFQYIPKRGARCLELKCIARVTIASTSVSSLLFMEQHVVRKA